jgi:hypothetical protein
MFHRVVFDNHPSTLLETDVYVHFDVEKLAYRVGQILDDLDRQTVSGLVFVHKADCTQVDNGNPIQFSLAPPSGNNHDVKMKSAASRSDLVSSEQKAQKIPKPRNKWIIYRQEKHSIVLEKNPGMHTSLICRYIVPFALSI